VASGLSEPHLLEQIGAVARRSVIRTTRQRGLLAFPILFPLILFAINGSALSAATKIPGFPPVSYRAFLLAVPFMQGALFVAVTAGVDLARDIESGFFNRLAMTPVRPSAMLAGQMGGPLLVAAIQSVIYLLVGIATGVGIASGVGGALVLLVLSVLIAFGSGEAVQAMFPLLFVTLFLSSSSLPRNLLKVSWFHFVATYNPASYLIEGIRSLVISGWDARALALGFGFAAAILVVTIGLSSLAMKTRLQRS
jgi:ABC-2 type transport system permease protein